MSTCSQCGSPLRESDRSVPQLRRFFSVIRAAYMHWPESHPRQFACEDDCRRFLQMKAGHREISATIDLGGISKEHAMLIAEASIRAAGAYAVPVLHGETLVIFKPKSIAFAKLDHKAFCKLNDEVDAVISAEIGIEAETLLKETERAA
jgi:hypothetical protein